MPIYKSNTAFDRLDLSLLRHFSAVSSFGGFSKASRATGISQPALSLGLQKLEKTLGTRLIDRRAGRFALTRSGEVLNAFCKRIEGGLESMLGELGGDRASVAKRLRIGTALSVGFGPLAKACRENAQRVEPIELELTAQNTFQLLSAVKEGSLEAALVPDDVYDRHLSVTPLFRDKLAFVYSPSLKRLYERFVTDSRPSTVLVTYPRETPMRSLVDQVCGKRRLRFKSVVSVNGLDAILGLVREGAGGAFVLRSMVSEELAKRELYEVRFPFPLPAAGVMLVTSAGEHGREAARMMKKFLG